MVAEIERRKISDLKPDAANVRAHDARNLDAIRASLRTFGQQKPIVVDAKGVVIAGNGTLLAAEAEGWGEIDVVVSDLEGANRTAYAIADNRTAELAAWHDDELAKTLEALRADPTVDELVAGFSSDEIDELLAAVGMPSGNIVEDEPPKLLPEPIGAVGDLWKMGRHRVLCGDCTKADDVDRLMGGHLAQMVFTDPPYGVDYDGGTVAREKLAGDGDTALYAPACKMSHLHTDAKAALYLWHAGVKGIAAAAAAAAAGYEIRCELVWNKNLAQFGALSAQYKQKHETAYYCFKKGHPPRWYGPTNEVTVWECDRAAKNEYHPTQKPVALAARAMANSSAQGHVVVDWFLGSGSTLIAAEQLGRTCYGLEIEPRYVDVTIRRWLKLIGESPVRESDGAKWTDLADGVET